MAMNVLACAQVLEFKALTAVRQYPVRVGDALLFFSNRTHLDQSPVVDGYGPDDQAESPLRLCIPTRPLLVGSFVKVYQELIIFH